MGATRPGHAKLEHAYTYYCTQLRTGADLRRLGRDLGHLACDLGSGGDLRRLGRELEQLVRELG